MLTCHALERVRSLLSSPNTGTIPRPESPLATYRYLQSLRIWKSRFPWYADRCALANCARKKRRRFSSCHLGPDIGHHFDTHEREYRRIASYRSTCVLLTTSERYRIWMNEI
jgi:hypothetical protein